MGRFSLPKSTQNMLLAYQRGIAEETSTEGTAQTFDLWLQSAKSGGKRVAFYCAVLNRNIKKLEEKLNTSLRGTKLIISGMTSSSIGIVEIPYSSIPLPVDGTGIKTVFIAADEFFEHDLLIISGVRSSDDVMRGEETQLIGCIETGQLVKNGLYIFPGTHSKHILVRDNHIRDFKTYMTGELFALLSQKSILKNAVEKGSQPDPDSFKQGLRDAVSTNLLNAFFKVRTRQLFDVCDKNENYGYLSGLLIGTELKDLAETDADVISLVSSDDISKYYLAALSELLPDKNIKAFSSEQADNASVMGQIKIGRQLQILA